MRYLALVFFLGCGGDAFTVAPPNPDASRTTVAETTGLDANAVDVAPVLDVAPVEAAPDVIRNDASAAAADAGQERDAAISDALVAPDVCIVIPFNECFRPM
jgi:hypothetical protein